MSNNTFNQIDIPGRTLSTKSPSPSPSPIPQSVSPSYQLTRSIATVTVNGNQTFFNQKEEKVHPLQVPLSGNDGTLGIPVFSVKSIKKNTNGSYHTNKDTPKPTTIPYQKQSKIKKKKKKKFIVSELENDDINNNIIDAKTITIIPGSNNDIDDNNDDDDYYQNDLITINNKKRKKGVHLILNNNCKQFSAKNMRKQFSANYSSHNKQISSRSIITSNSLLSPINTDHQQNNSKNSFGLSSIYDTEDLYDPPVASLHSSPITINDNNNNLNINKLNLNNKDNSIQSNGTFIINDNQDEIEIERINVLNRGKSRSVSVEFENVCSTDSDNESDHSWQNDFFYRQHYSVISNNELLPIQNWSDIKNNKNKINNQSKYTKNNITTNQNQNKNNNNTFKRRSMVQKIKPDGINIPLNNIKQTKSFTPTVGLNEKNNKNKKKRIQKCGVYYTKRRSTKTFFELQKELNLNDQYNKLKNNMRPLPHKRRLKKKKKLKRKVTIIRHRQPSPNSKISKISTFHTEKINNHSYSIDDNGNVEVMDEYDDDYDYDYDNHKHKYKYKHKHKHRHNHKLRHKSYNNIKYHKKHKHKSNNNKKRKQFPEYKIINSNHANTDVTFDSFANLNIPEFDDGFFSDSVDFEYREYIGTEYGDGSNKNNYDNIDIISINSLNTSPSSSKNINKIVNKYNLKQIRNAYNTGYLNGYNEGIKNIQKQLGLSYNSFINNINNIEINK